VVSHMGMPVPSSKTARVGRRFGWILVDGHGELLNVNGSPTVGKMRQMLANRAPVQFEQINLRVADSYGMCGYRVRNFPRKSRNLLGSVFMAALGGDIQVHYGPLAVTGWIPATGERQPLPLRFQVMVEHMHANVVSALVGGSTAYGGDWMRSVREIGRYLHTAPAEEVRPVQDFFGRDKTKVRWWVCPNGEPACTHAGIWHETDYPHRCNIDTCTCIAF
jgi:hypothetical protein